MVRRVAQRKGGKANVMGRVVRVGLGPRCSKPLGDWERAAVWDLSIVAWTED